MQIDFLQRAEKEEETNDEVEDDVEEEEDEDEEESEEEADVCDMEDMIDEIVERERLTSLASAQPNTIEIDVPLMDTLNLPLEPSRDVCECLLLLLLLCS